MKQKDKVLFLALKGIGDLLIISNFIVQSKKKYNLDIVVVLSARLAKFKYLFPYDISFITVNERFESIYYIKSKFIYIFYIFKLRSLVKKYINEGYQFFIYDNYIKNILLFLGLNKTVIYGPYVYNNLENIFNLKITPKLKITSNKYLIFPFGNDKKRQLNHDELMTIENHLKARNFDYKILVHDSQKYLIKNYQRKKIITYKKFTELDFLFKDYTECITVDSSFLHLAILNNLRCIVISDSWDNYLHKDLLNSRMKISKKNIHNLDMLLI